MRQFLKRNMYKYHRIIGLITIIPVIFWCLSGLMHPFLAHWFKPKIANEFIIPKPINKDQIKRNLKDILTNNNNIKEFKTFRLVEFNNHTYYQVKTISDEWLYFDSQTGVELTNGDKIYAEYLARFFLADSTSAVKSITQVNDFSQQYKFINRLLPVWKVSFDRPDHMDVYVETPYSRLGTFNPTSRKIFLWVFDNFHNWSFISKISNNTLRIAVMLLFLGIIIISSLSGILIYGFMWNKFKRPNSEDKKGILRKYHRQIGISVALVSLTFAFSGGYHATRKLTPNVLPKMIHEPIITLNELNDSLVVNQIDFDGLTNLSIVKTDNANYYQAFYNQKDKEPVYLEAKSGSIWENGNSNYAIFLANKFKEKFLEWGLDNTCCEEGSMDLASFDGPLKVLKTELVPKFEKREYGFAFKRLPVVRVATESSENTNYYIETSTSRLSARVENSDRYEGYSFAILHKFLFMDWAGKNVRDIVMMISALGVLVVSLFGLVLFLKK